MVFAMLFFLVLNLVCGVLGFGTVVSAFNFFVAGCLTSGLLYNLLIK